MEGRIISKARKLRLEYAAKLGESVTVDDVARELGISRQWLTAIELGQMQQIGTNLLINLCEFYSRVLDRPINVGDLMEYTANKQTPISPAVMTA